MALSNMQKQQAFRDRKKATPLAEALFDGAMNMTRNTFLETMEFDGNRFHEYLNDCEFSETQEFQDERDEIYRAAYEKAYTDRYSELYEERYPEAFEECYAKIRANDSDIDDVEAKMEAKARVHDDINDEVKLEAAEAAKDDANDEVMKWGAAADRGVYYSECVEYRLVDLVAAYKEGCRL